ncbi:hypothetical protein [Clostridium taeniosporum]|nr:hypothetical protein [Clostridium taeniosporum]
MMKIIIISVTIITIFFILGLCKISSKSDEKAKYIFKQIKNNNEKNY